MSATTETPRRLTVVDIAKLYADGVRLPMLTAYDFPTAQILDEAGIPMLLVGDSLGQVLLGYETTVRVTMTEMIHHTKAVVRGSKRAMVIGDMPFLSYSTPEDALENAGIFLREAGRPGGQGRGRRPQRPDHRDAGPRRDPGHGPHRPDAAGHQHDRQGPRPGQEPRPGPRAHRRRPGGPGGGRLRAWSWSSSRSSSRRRSPSGSGSRRSASAPGAGCSGQVQVITDLIGLGDFVPKHARPYANVRKTILEAARAYAAEVAAGTFPGEAETVRMDDARPRRGPRPRRARPGDASVDPGRRDPARPRPVVPVPGTRRAS